MALPEKQLQVRDMLAFGTKNLMQSSRSARLDAELLLAHVLKSSRTRLIIDSLEAVTEVHAQRYFELIERRRKSEPVAYLTGKKEFYGREFGVNSSVLIPRPETELLVELALAHLKHSKEPYRILDLGTGSGCIALSIAAELELLSKRFEVLAVDFSEAALLTAKSNCKALGLDRSVNFLQSDWFSSIDPTFKFDVIVSNPPYIAEGDANVGPEISYEPRSALYGGSSGMSDILKILNYADLYLSEEGTVFLEIASEQRDLLLESFPHKYTFQAYPDLSGRTRAVAAKKKSSNSRRRQLVELWKLP